MNGCHYLIIRLRNSSNKQIQKYKGDKSRRRKEKYPFNSTKFVYIDVAEITVHNFVLISKTFEQTFLRYEVHSFRKVKRKTHENSAENNNKKEVLHSRERFCDNFHV
jgi:hypothetical protein